MGSNSNEQWALVDLDGTLYPMGIGVMRRIGSRIDRFMQDRLGLDEAEIRRLRQTYYRRHGTSMRGLYLNHGVDPDQYLRYVHSVSVSGLLAPNEGLGRALARCPWRKVIFTNASAGHAENVLRALGVRGQFSRIIDLCALEYVNKPRTEAYRRVLAILDVKASCCVFVEDSVRNLIPAGDLGMGTVLVSPDGAEETRVDCVIERLRELPEALVQMKNVSARPSATQGIE